MLASLIATMLLVAPPSASSWSLMTFNVLYDGADLEGNLTAIATTGPDVLCLQEVTKSFVRGFEAKLAKVYPFRRFEPRTGTWGVGIASKHPLRNVNVFKQVPHRMPAIEAAVTLDGRTVVVACVHLFPPEAKRRSDTSTFEAMRENASLRVKQAEALVARYGSHKGPVILLGDMNEDSDNDAVELLKAAGYKDSCDVDGEDCGGTYPGATSIWPAVFQVDHILGRGITFLEASVLKIGGSDHFPVVARFRF